LTNESAPDIAHPKSIHDIITQLYSNLYLMVISMNKNFTGLKPGLLIK